MYGSNSKKAFNECSFSFSNSISLCSILNNPINGLRERALRLVYNDFSSTFSELLIEDKSVMIHQRNLQALAFEIFKVKNLVPEIMKTIFSFNTLPNSLRNSTTLPCKTTKQFSMDYI